MCEQPVPFGGRIVLLGFGSIGQAVLPLLLRHLDISPAQVLIAKPSERGTEKAPARGVLYKPVTLPPTTIAANWQSFCRLATS